MNIWKHLFVQPDQIQYGVTHRTEAETEYKFHCDFKNHDICSRFQNDFSFVILGILICIDPHGIIL